MQLEVEKLWCSMLKKKKKQPNSDTAGDFSPKLILLSFINCIKVASHLHQMAPSVTETLLLLPFFPTSP